MWTCGRWWAICFAEISFMMKLLTWDEHTYLALLHWQVHLRHFDACFFLSFIICKNDNESCSLHTAAFRRIIINQFMKRWRIIPVLHRQPRKSCTTIMQNMTTSAALRYMWWPEAEDKFCSSGMRWQLVARHWARRLSPSLLSRLHIYVVVY